MAPPWRPPAASCRLCGAGLRRLLLDLGEQPLATALVATGQAERLYPLRVWQCDACDLVQVADALPPHAAAPRPAAPACPEAAAARATRHVATLQQRFHLDARSLVIDTAAHDATLLQAFEAAGIPVFGLPADTAFNTETAMDIAVRYGCADVIVAHDLLPHAADLFDCAAGLACILRPNGVLCLQFPHLLSLLQRVQFDAFRHDTFAYLSLPAAERLLRSVGLRVFDAERVPDDGGSLRLYACHAHAPRPARPGVRAVRTAEAAAQEGQPDSFRDRVALACDDIRGFLRIRQEAGRRVAAYGATARGIALLNGCGVTAQDIAYVADNEPLWHGRRLPGSHIPVAPVEALMRDPPDDVIILPWPGASEITARLQALRRAGTLFWTVLPRIGRV
ncbi:hypothetical protein CCS01_22880 [Rhodopila globiformis]|uniref:C-methyltransferase domain-containing protein n=2 Tax=Rhodopila globiformis TaxID=1071 RepID=A0A2S6N387_RHOGL|nr:hypothetical protein CCS01_22880 [Rhodopila globiformis]